MVDTIFATDQSPLKRVLTGRLRIFRKFHRMTDVKNQW